MKKEYTMLVGSRIPDEDKDGSARTAVGLFSPDGGEVMVSMSDEEAEHFPLDMEVRVTLEVDG